MAENILLTFSQAVDSNAGNGFGIATLITGIIVVYAPLFLIPLVALKAVPVLNQVLGMAKGATDWLSSKGRGGIANARKNQNSWLGGKVHRAKEEREEHGLTAGTILGSLNAGRKARFGSKKNRRKGVGFREAAGGYQQMRIDRATKLGTDHSEKNLEAAQLMGDDVSASISDANRLHGEHFTTAHLEEAFMVKEPLRALDHELRPDTNEQDARIWARQEQNWRAKGVDMNDPATNKEKLEEFNAEMKENGGLDELNPDGTVKKIGKNRKARNANVALANDILGKMGRGSALTLANRKLAGSSTGFFSAAEMMERAVAAAGGEHGSDDQMLAVMEDMSNRANQAGMYDLGKGSIPEMWKIMKKMQAAKAAGGDDGKGNLDLSVDGKWNKMINRAARNKMGAYDFAQQHRSSAAHMVYSGILTEDIEAEAGRVEAELGTDPEMAKHLLDMQAKLKNEGIHSIEIDQARADLLKTVNEKGADHEDVHNINARIQELQADQAAKTPEQAAEHIRTRVRSEFNDHLKKAIFKDEKVQTLMADYSAVYENLRAGSKDVRNHLAHASEVELGQTGMTINEALGAVRNDLQYSDYHNRMREYAAARGGGRPGGVSEAEWAAMSEAQQQALRQQAEEQANAARQQQQQ